MKRIVSAFLAGAMALSLAACGGASSTAVSSTASSAARVFSQFDGLRGIFRPYGGESAQVSRGYSASAASMLASTLMPCWRAYAISHFFGWHSIQRARRNFEHSAKVSSKTLQKAALCRAASKIILYFASSSALAAAFCSSVTSMVHRAARSASEPSAGSFAISAAVFPLR